MQSREEPALREGRLFAFLKRAAYFGTAPLVCLLLYWPGLHSWYQMDDFAWLTLANTVHDVPSLLSALFTPYAQGTIRPISERLFFLSLWSIFGTDALPARAIVFATMGANLVLLTALARRLTRSAVAGFTAPLLWIVNANFYMPMAWTSAYNQVLCAAVMLGALYLFVRYTETGSERYLVSQWIVFLLGFGVLEINVVYPALAATYALCCARPYLRSTVPMFAVSLIYTGVNRAFAPAARSGAYALHFDPASLLSSLWAYIWHVPGADRYASYRGWDIIPFQFAEAVVWIGLVFFAIRMLRKGRHLAAFLMSWFVIVLLPVLPLRDHVTHYYLTVPAVGLAILGGWAIGHARGAWRAVAVCIALIYAVPSAWAARGMTAEVSRISREVRTFTASLAAAHRDHPRQTILVRGIDEKLFWRAWAHRPYRLFGRTAIFLDSDSERRIRPDPEFGDTWQYFLAGVPALAGLRNGTIVAFDVLPDGRLRQNTVLYRAQLERRPDLTPARTVNVADPAASMQLGDGWWQNEGAYRWTARRAVLRLGGPAKPGAHLAIQGYCPDNQLAHGPIQLTLSINGRDYPAHEINAANQRFRFTYPLDPSLAGRSSMQVAVTLNRTMRVPGDVRDLGVTFGTFSVVH